MKRSTILLLLLLLLIICGLICYECCDSEETPTCENLIFVAVNRIPDEEYNDWQVENQEYMYDVPTGKKEVNTGDGIVAIDASKIRESDYAAWLRDNGDFIFYEETYPYIECAHNITGATITNIGPYTSLTLSQLKSQISANGGSYFATNYNRYTRLSFNTSNVMTLEMVDRYVFNETCFSVPLFRSIVNKYNLKNTSVFQFAKATVNDRASTIIRVNVGGGSYNYYDYSQIPP
ncbi:hypothetical protein [Flavobacterium soli]|uniref:hypothetical protein n=1 Tax=Flavobacterium soli TaxID=344881 RepID=UPI0003F611F1|nr:hypothetical protein [Flavobacterium soli]